MAPFITMQQMSLNHAFKTCRELGRADLLHLLTGLLIGGLYPAISFDGRSKTSCEITLNFERYCYGETDEERDLIEDELKTAGFFVQGAHAHLRLAIGKDQYAALWQEPRLIS